MVFRELNPLLHSPLRLAIMSILISIDSADFVFLKQQTEASSGNLSVQIDKLQNAGYISIEKGFKGNKPCTTCRITAKGITQFEEYVEVLKGYIG